MYSWWWVRLSPETCRVKSLRRIKTQLLHLVGLISLLPSIRIKRNLFSTEKAFGTLQIRYRQFDRTCKQESFFRLPNSKTSSKLVLNGINKHATSFSEMRIYGTRGVRPLGSEKRCSRLIFPCHYHCTNTPYSLPNATVYQGTPASLLTNRCSVESRRFKDQYRWRLRSLGLTLAVVYFEEKPTVLCLWSITDLFQLKVKWDEVHHVLCVWWQYWYCLYR